MFATKDQMKTLGGSFCTKVHSRKTKSSMLFWFYCRFMHVARTGDLPSFSKKYVVKFLCKKCPPPCTRRTGMFVTSWINSQLQRMSHKEFFTNRPHHSHPGPSFCWLSLVCARQCFLQTFLIQFHMKFSLFIFTFYNDIA